MGLTKSWVLPGYKLLPCSVPFLASGVKKLQSVHYFGRNVRRKRAKHPETLSKFGFVKSGELVPVYRPVEALRIIPVVTARVRAIVHEHAAVIETAEKRLSVVEKAFAMAAQEHHRDAQTLRWCAAVA